MVCLISSSASSSASLSSSSISLFLSSSFDFTNPAHLSVNLEYGSPWSRHTSTTVMLSQPKPPIWQSGDKHRVISSSQMSSGSMASASLLVTKSATSWLDKTSQMPSQASTRKSQSLVTSATSTSGSMASA